MDTIKALLDFGLAEQEAQTYLTLFRLGGATASVLAKEAGLKRTTIYPILKSLSQKGCILVYFKKNQHHYYAQNPNKLSELLEKKVEFFNSVIPMFESMEKKQAKAVGLRFIETKEELENFYNDVLYEYKNKKYRVIGNTNEWEATDPEFFANYRKERSRLNTKVKLLLSTDSIVSNPTEKSLLRQFKYLPEKYKFKSTMNIFDDKVLIVSPSQSSLAVVIAVPAMVDIFKSMFEIIWESTNDGNNSDH